MKKNIATAFSRMLSAWRTHPVLLLAAVAAAFLISSAVTNAAGMLPRRFPSLQYLPGLLIYPVIVGLARIFWRACLGNRPRLCHLFAYYTQPRVLLALAVIQLLANAVQLCLRPLISRAIWSDNAASRLCILIPLALSGLLFFITMYLVILCPQAGLAQLARLYAATWRRRWRALLAFYGMYFMLENALLPLVQSLWYASLGPLHPATRFLGYILQILKMLLLVSHSAAFAGVILSVRHLHRPRRRDSCRLRLVQPI